MLTIRAIDSANRELLAAGGTILAENACPTPIMPVFRLNGLHQPKVAFAKWGESPIFQAISSSEWEKEFVLC